MDNFMEVLMEESIFSGGKNLSEGEWQTLAYQNGEKLIPILNKHFPTPDKAVSSIIAILANLTLLEPDPLKRITLLNNVHNAVLGMVEVYEKGDFDELESGTESSAEETESPAVDLFEGTSGDEEGDGEEVEEFDEDDEDEYEEEVDEDEGDEVDDEEGETPEIEEEEEEPQEALDVAGYQPEELEE